MALTVLLSSAVVPSARGRDVILEARDVQSLGVAEKRPSPALVLHLSGLVFHSALGVSRVTSVVEGDALIVLVHLSLVRGAMSGNLEYDLGIPPTVNVVKLGNEKTVVWRRGGGGPGP